MAQFRIIPGRPWWQLIAAYAFWGISGIGIWLNQSPFIVLLAWIGVGALFTVGIRFVLAFTYWLEEDSGRLNGKKRTPGWFWAFPGFTTFQIVVVEVQETEHAFEATTSDGGELKDGKIIVRWRPNIKAVNHNGEDLFISLGGKPSFDATIIGFLRAYVQSIISSLAVNEVNSGRSALRDMITCQFKLEAEDRPENNLGWLARQGLGSEDPMVQALRNATTPQARIKAIFGIYGHPNVSGKIVHLLKERGYTQSYLEREGGVTVIDIAELTFQLSDQSVETLRTKQKLDATTQVRDMFKGMDKETQEAILTYEGHAAMHIVRTAPGAGNMNINDLNLGDGKKGGKS